MVYLGTLKKHGDVTQTLKMRGDTMQTLEMQDSIAFKGCDAAQTPKIRGDIT